MLIKQKKSDKIKKNYGFKRERAVRNSSQKYMLEWRWLGKSYWGSVALMGFKTIPPHLLKKII